MFIFTAKFNKKKAVAAVLILAVILIAIILIAGTLGKDNSKETAALSAVVKNNEQRVAYLNSLGWEVEAEPIEEQAVVIPREFTTVYKDYNELQIAQGFDLTKYGGIEATRYTYKVLNYPNVSGNVVADIIVYRSEVIAGDVQSNSLDGFMVGLKYPQITAKTSDSNAAEPSAKSNSPEPKASDSGDSKSGASESNTSESDVNTSESEAVENADVIESDVSESEASE
jgi:hypothetical protein